MPRKDTKIRAAALLLSGIAHIALPNQARSQDYDPSPAWPLCGRITEDPNESWDPVSNPDCPAYRWGDAAYSDIDSQGRFNSTFGPRHLFSENDRYDFHRGLDISTPIGTPVFAITDGIVRHAGMHASYDDPVIAVRHFRPGQSSCSGVGCYHAMYLHVSGWVVAADEPVVKGQLLGYSGASGVTGYQHLHFEIRDAPAFDPFSSWQRDTIHPLNVLPYDNPVLLHVSIDSVATGGDGEPDVEVTVTGARDDVVRVEVELKDVQGNVIGQPGNTPDQLGYNVYPAFFDLDAWNFQYTHKNASGFPWSSDDAGGANACPYSAEHPESYTAHVHTDKADPNNFQEGMFNGLRIRTIRHSQGDYWLNVTFRELQGQPSCIVATATLAGGSTHGAEWGSCGDSSPPENTAPVADAQSLQTDRNVPLDIVLMASDADGDSLAYQVVSGPAQGSLTGSGASLTYTPDADYVGADAFTFEVGDGNGGADSAVIDIQVEKPKGGPGGGGGKGKNK